MKLTTQKIAGLGILGALSIIGVLLIRFPIIPAAPYLEYDPADIFIFLATFMYGPIAGLILTVVVSVLQGFTVSASSGIMGILMHILATSSFVAVAGFIYKYNRNIKGAIAALSLGTVAWIVVIIPANLVITPLFLGVPVEAVVSLIIPVLLPFNIIKAGVNGMLSFIIYKRTHKIINKVLNIKNEDYSNYIGITKSSNSTFLLGRRFAKTLKSNDIVLLNGVLGAGKTVFTKGIAKGLGVKELVSSPTFNIVKEYIGRLDLVHFDMYRIEQEKELYEIGATEYFNREKSVIAIEWNKFANICGTIYTVDIVNLNNNSRKITITKEIKG